MSFRTKASSMVLVFATTLAAACTPYVPTARQRAPAPVATPRPIATDVLLEQLLDEVNRARVGQGAQPLTGDDRLNAAASDYARELAQRRRLSHESPTASRRTLGERLAAAGAADWMRAGENLAKVHLTEPDVAARIVSLWLGSAGHRRNLLDPKHRLSGIGATRAADGYWYVTQVYATPRSEPAQR